MDCCGGGGSSHICSLDLFLLLSSLDRRSQSKLNSINPTGGRTPHRTQLTFPNSISGRARFPRFGLAEAPPTGGSTPRRGDDDRLAPKVSSAEAEAQSSCQYILRRRSKQGEQPPPSNYICSLAPPPPFLFLLMGGKPW